MPSYDPAEYDPTQHPPSVVNVTCPHGIVYSATYKIYGVVIEVEDLTPHLPECQDCADESWAETAIAHLLTGDELARLIAAEGPAASIETRD